MKIGEMFPRKWMIGADLGGKAFTVKIEAVQQEQIQVQGGKQEKRWVLYLKGSKKGLILNRTIAEQIAAVVGTDETQEWGGKSVTIYPVAMTVAGQERVAIRVRKPDAAATAHAEAMEHDDEEDATASPVGGQE